MPEGTNVDILLVPVPRDDQRPALPTYSTVADVLEKKNGSGWRLAGWTAARTLLIAPPMLVVGVPAKQAFAGALLASGMISLLTLARIGHASKEAGVPAAVSGHRKDPYRGRGHYR